MTGYAIYRLPHQRSCTLIEGSVCTLLHCTDLSSQSGFVVTPFLPSDHTPITLIKPEKVEALCNLSAIELADTAPSPSTLYAIQPPTTLKGKDGYAVDFANFHAQLLSGTFRKIVLARCVAEPNNGTLTPMQLFQRACQRYPRMFIALVSTPTTGTWLTATPELLLDSDDNAHWRTIALAGTMKLEAHQLNSEGETLRWSTKNIEEQRLVATYMAESLEQFTADFNEEGPRTVRAANLVHLRSDFTFTLPPATGIGHLLHALHPTPAVGGLPKHEALQFIAANEQTPRLYYSGFMGPLLLPHPAETPATHLYVSLRCMNITPHTYYLYAGGGLLKDSTMQQEWQETEAKLETMRTLL